MVWKDHRVENKQRLVYTTRDYVHQKENMPANATLRPECKHFPNHRSPKEPLSYKVTTSHTCNVQFVLLIKGYTIFAVNTRHIYNICKN